MDDEYYVEPNLGRGRLGSKKDYNEGRKLYKGLGVEGVDRLRIGQQGPRRMNIQIGFVW
ncbi:MAG: hypothetical protein ACJAZB_001498 [Psychrosphaera sp.]|jgi:hypothetical protein